MSVGSADFVEKVRTKTVEIASTRAVRRVIEQTKAMPTRFSAAFRPAFSSALSANPASVISLRKVCFLSTKGPI